LKVDVNLSNAKKIYINKITRW